MVKHDLAANIFSSIIQFLLSYCLSRGGGVGSTSVFLSDTCLLRVLK